jgi:tetratricopeptide (TPR) repeat protein
VILGDPLAPLQTYSGICAASSRSQSWSTEDRSVSLRADEVLSEQRSEDEQSSVLPYHLDLAYTIICDRGAQFDPSDLGDTPGDVQIRFLRYLQTGQPDVFQAFRCLALAGSFDKELFNYLVANNCISAGLNFSVLTGDDYSFVEEVVQTSGTFRFHRTMERALIDNQAAKEDDRTTARERIDAIIGYFKKKAAFSRPDDCTAQHRDAYKRGMAILFDRHRDGLIDVHSLGPVFGQFEAPFGETFLANERIAWWVQLADLLKTNLSVPYLYQCLTVLGSLCYAAGDPVNAESCFRQALQGCEGHHGLDDLQRLNTIVILADLLREKGDLIGAETFYHRALEGYEHQDENINTVNCFNSMGIFLQKRGDLENAERFFRRAIAGFERLSDEYGRITAKVIWVCCFWKKTISPALSLCFAKL